MTPAEARALLGAFAEWLWDHDVECGPEHVERFLATRQPQTTGPFINPLGSTVLPFCSRCQQRPCVCITGGNI